MFFFVFTTYLFDEHWWFKMNTHFNEKNPQLCLNFIGIVNIKYYKYSTYVIMYLDYILTLKNVWFWLTYN